MTIDTVGLEAGRRATTAAGSGAVHPAVDFAARSRSRSRRQLGGAVGVVLAVVVATTLALRSNDKTTASTPAAPAGVIPKLLQRADLGFSVEVPADWIDTTASSRYPFFYNGPTSPPVGFVLAQVLTSGETPLDGVADAFINNPNVVAVKARQHVSLDGVDAVRVRFTVRTVVQNGTTQTVDDTTFITRNHQGQLLTVTAGARSPRADDALVEWVASTIRILQ